MRSGAVEIMEARFPDFECFVGVRVKSSRRPACCATKINTGKCSKAPLCPRWRRNNGRSIPRTAYQTATQTALKVLTAALAPDADYMTGFRCEARAGIAESPQHCCIHGLEGALVTGWSRDRPCRIDQTGAMTLDETPPFLRLHLLEDSPSRPFAFALACRIAAQ
jgi:hypothetical protein